MEAENKEVATTKINEDHAGSCLTYNNIRSDGLADLGQYRTMKEKLGWRLRKPMSGIDPSTRPTTQVDGRMVRSVTWMSIGNRDYAMKIVMKNQEVMHFAGFKSSDYEALYNHIKKYWGVEMKKVQLSTRGWHWGVNQPSEHAFTFHIDGSEAIEIPCSRISQIAINKLDVSMLLDYDEKRGDVEDQLTELRFSIPVSKTDTEDHAELLHKMFASLPLSKSRLSPDPLCVFFDVKLLVPAGRFDVHITSTFMKLHGKSNDFKILYATIVEMYLLYEPSSLHVNIVLRLASPLRKGHTPYHNAILQFDEKKTINLDLNGSNEEIDQLKASFKSSCVDMAVDSNMTGEEYKIASSLLVALVQKDVITSQTFKSAADYSCFRCSYKAESGQFYPLEDGFIFIHKPVIIMKYQDIASIGFGRTAGSQRKFFEFDVLMQGGPTHSFSSVDRQESNPFLEFLKKKNITVRSLQPDNKSYGGSVSFLEQDLESEDESDSEVVDESNSDSESFSTKEDDDDASLTQESLPDDVSPLKNKKSSDSIPGKKRLESGTNKKR